jgi:hypothetical protein
MRLQERDCTRLSRIYLEVRIPGFLGRLLDHEWCCSEERLLVLLFGSSTLEEELIVVGLIMLNVTKPISEWRSWSTTSSAAPGMRISYC